MNEVCKKELCTGCGACINICPVGAISFIEDPENGNKAQINQSLCVDCKLCKKTCPIEKIPEFLSSTQCYAAWSNDSDTRRTSASGGIASEMYRFYTNEHGWYAGCYMNPDNNAVFTLENSNYKKFQNSKYVYSDMKDIYKHVEKKLLENNRVLFIGLPCQVAGIKNYLICKNVCMENLVCADIICHGVIRPQWLKDYIQEKENLHNRHATCISFRNPSFETNNFVLSLADENGIFQAAMVNRSDEYQLAYHKGISYRDNCYLCRFAQKNRVGDITLADFTGVGTIADYSFSKENISCVLINSTQGSVLFNNLITNSYIQADKRPINEEYNREQRLISPTPHPKERSYFLKLIRNGKSFSYAIRKSMKVRIIKNEIKYYLNNRSNLIKQVISKWDEKKN